MNENASLIDTDRSGLPKGVGVELRQIYKIVPSKDCTVVKTIETIIIVLAFRDVCTKQIQLIC